MSLNGSKTKWILPSSGRENQHLGLKNLFHSAPASFPQSSCYQSSGHHTWISPDLAIWDPEIKEKNLSDIFSPNPSSLPDLPSEPHRTLSRCHPLPRTPWTCRGVWPVLAPQPPSQQSHRHPHRPHRSGPKCRWIPRSYRWHHPQPWSPDTPMGNLTTHQKTVVLLTKPLRWKPIFPAPGLSREFYKSSQPKVSWMN